MADDTVMYAVMKKSRMVEPAFRLESEANQVRDAYRRDARDERYQVRMVTVHERLDLVDSASEVSLETGEVQP